ncbi:hypothetical protein D3C73_772610 [compost metagenome]
MSQAIFDAFTSQCRAKLAEACTKYSLTIKPEDVRISYDVRGGVAGRAGVKRTGLYFMQFNPEAVLKYNDDMTTDTIPHEVAHLVCFNQKHLGKGHDYGWKRVCRALGGDDSRTHDYTLTPGKVTEKFNYTLASGRVVQAGPKHHRLIQAGGQVFWRNPKEYARADQWEHYGKVAQPVQMAARAHAPIPGLNIVRSDIPALPQFGSKRERAELIYKANKHLARGEVIKLFVAHAEMTPAGAATYYQNFKKAGI